MSVWLFMRCRRLLVLLLPVDALTICAPGCSCRLLTMTIWPLLSSCYKEACHGCTLDLSAAAAGNSCILVYNPTTHATVCALLIMSSLSLYDYYYYSSTCLRAKSSAARLCLPVCSYSPFFFFLSCLFIYFLFLRLGFFLLVLKLFFAFLDIFTFTCFPLRNVPW